MSRGISRWSFFDRVAEAASIQPRDIPQSQSHAALPQKYQGGEHNHRHQRPLRGMLVCVDKGPNREHRRCLLTGTFRSNGVVPEDRIRDRGPETLRLFGDQKNLPDCNHQKRPEPPASFKQTGNTPRQVQRSLAGKVRQALTATTLPLLPSQSELEARSALKHELAATVRRPHSPVNLLSLERVRLPGAEC